MTGLLEKLAAPVRTHRKHVIVTLSGQVQRLRRSDGTSETPCPAADQLGRVAAVLEKTSFAA